MLFSVLRYIFFTNSNFCVFKWKLLSDKQQKQVVLQSFTCCYSCDCESEWPMVTCGEPQGSTLGPLWFNIEMLWLGHIRQNMNINHHNYTDDTHTSVRELHQWMTGWLLNWDATWQNSLRLFQDLKFSVKLITKPSSSLFKNSKYHIQSELREQRSEDTKQVSGQWTGFQSERFKMLLDCKFVPGWGPTKP